MTRNDKPSTLITNNREHPKTPYEELAAKAGGGHPIATALGARDDVRVPSVRL
jgi:hypothetical protein